MKEDLCPHIPNVPKVPRGGRRGIKLSEKHKDQVKATNLMNRIKDAADGKVEMTSNQIRAAELYLSKTVPSLSAVEQTNIDEADSMTTDQLMATLKMMLDNPATKRMLRQLLDDSDKPSLSEVKVA